jgi:hypothetical protein
MSCANTLALSKVSTNDRKNPVRIIPRLQLGPIATWLFDAFGRIELALRLRSRGLHITLSEKDPGDAGGEHCPRQRNVRVRSSGRLRRQSPAVDQPRERRNRICGRLDNELRTCQF